MWQPGDMRKHRDIRLSEAERDQLSALLTRATHAARTIPRANILLHLARHTSYGDTAPAVGCCERTVRRTANRFVAEGLAATLTDKPRSGAPPKLDAAVQAQIIATACSTAPEGRSRWTLRIGWSNYRSSPTSATKRCGRRKKNELKPWRHQQWCIPTVSPQFVARMAAGLDEYAQPYDPRHPRVCFEEKVVYLLDRLRGTIEMRAKTPTKADDEYRHEGTATLFVMVEPQRGYRHGIVRERRTARDYAQALKWLGDEGYPQAQIITVV